ncbi:MAG: hypothetical protein ACOCSK_02245, partial [Rhodothermales bacterium]
QVVENLNPQQPDDARWFVASSGSVTADIPEFSETSSGTDENVSVQGTISVQQILPDPQTTTSEFFFSYDGWATVVSGEDMEDYQE